MMGRTIAPALAMGNATVLKPAEDACLTTLRVAQLAIEGRPAGGRAQRRDRLRTRGGCRPCRPCRHWPRDIHGLDRSGYPRAAGGGAERRETVLELGGKSPQVVFDDADLDLALPIIVRAIIQNTGQTCTAGSRLLVQRKIYDEFVARVSARKISCRPRRHARVMDLDCGPVINQTQYKTCYGHIADAEKSGLAVAAKGQLADGLPAGGFYVQPSLFGNVPATARWHGRRFSVRSWPRCPSMMRLTASRWPTRPNWICSPPCEENGGRQQAAGVESDPAARSSSIATAPAAASSCLSAASRRADMAARRASWPWRR